MAKGTKGLRDGPEIGSRAWNQGIGQRLSDLLNEVLQGQPLTATSQISGDTDLIDRACWLRETGHDAYEIAAILGLPVSRVCELVAIGYTPPTDSPNPLSAEVEHNANQNRQRVARSAKGRRSAIG